MTLETLLKIGRTFRKAEGFEGLRFHCYLKTLPEKISGIKFFVVRVNPDDYAFDLRKKEEITDENYIRNRLLYLDYKTSYADSTKKYIAGDIFRIATQKKDGKVKQYGNFQHIAGKLDDSYTRSKKTTKGKKPEIESFKNTNVKKFHDAISCIVQEADTNGKETDYSNLDELKRVLEQHPACYIHFDFGGQCWYEQDDLLVLVNQQILNTYLTPCTNEQGFMMRSFLYKTLSVNQDNVPGLSLENHHKVRHFPTAEDFWDLVYSLDYSKKSAFSDHSLRVYVLPRGENLSAAQIQNFFAKSTSIENEDEEEKEEQSKQANKRKLLSDDPDEMFRAVLQNSDENFVTFDFVISKQPKSGPDNDLVTMSGLERSYLSHLSNEIRRKRAEIEHQMLREGYTKSEGLTIARSFMNIFGDAFPKSPKKRYQDHLMKALPKIYSGTYYDDPLLLPALIEKVELNIRNDNPDKSGGRLPGFNLLKFNYRFLVAIRNDSQYNERRLRNNMENEKGNETNDSQSERSATPSHDIGYLLGRLARPFAGENSPIKAFEKSYVGRLSRRVVTLNHLRALYIEINENLINHNLMGEEARQIAVDVVGKINRVGNGYNKNECAFGFFEGYYTR